MGGDRPPVPGTARGGGTVTAWLWAHTVVCPNPACRAIAPLVSSFWLAKRKGALTWIEPVDPRPGRRTLRRLVDLANYVDIVAAGTLGRAAAEDRLRSAPVPSRSPSDVLAEILAGPS